MKISIFGMGYVGVVSAGCFANDKYQVIGVDPVQAKVNMINDGQSPIIEKGIGELISKAIQNDLLKATTCATEAVKETQISFVCVGTPSQMNGDLDLKYIRRVCEEIGSALREKNDRHSVVIRSTILPGTIRKVVIPILEEYSCKMFTKDFGVCSNPEFLREGTAVYDFYNPAKTVIGEADSFTGDLVASIYCKIDAPLVRTNIETAEMIKYVDNVWHALKVGFSNEIGNICKQIGVDSYKVMDIFCQDTKLNISPNYMEPGFAFGGPCLPKDLRALNSKARSLGLNLPILNSILQSNELQIKKGLQMVMEKGGRKVAVLGFSFKAGTDDLRESPMVEMIERLLDKGYEIKIYDRWVNMAKLVGANRDYILNHIPHIKNMMVESIEEILSYAETIVIGNRDPEFKNVLDKIKDGQALVDLVRITDRCSESERYDGICW